MLESQITEKVILINVGQLYRKDMAPSELYEATRGIWIVAPDAHKADFAFSVNQGIVREVYAISRWRRANDPPFRRPDVLENDPRLKEGWVFEGGVAPEPIRTEYRGTSVRAYFTPASQNPVRFVNC